MTTQITQLTSWQLAKLAGCSDPDAHDGIGFGDAPGTVEDAIGSPGAQFLRNVEDDVNDRDEVDEDTAHEIADANVPVYTHELWQTFVDIAAYNEDVTELAGEVPDDLSKVASIALYMIAERLASALIQARNENALTCPECGSTNVTPPHGHHLAKCDSCHVAFDTMEDEDE